MFNLTFLLSRPVSLGLVSKHFSAKDLNVCWVLQRVIPLFGPFCEAFGRFLDSY